MQGSSPLRCRNGSAQPWELQTQTPMSTWPSTAMSNRPPSPTSPRPTCSFSSWAMARPPSICSGPNLSPTPNLGTILLAPSGCQGEMSEWAEVPRTARAEFSGTITVTAAVSVTHAVTSCVLRNPGARCLHAIHVDALAAGGYKSSTTQGATSLTPAGSEQPWRALTRLGGIVGGC